MVQLNLFEASKRCPRCAVVQPLDRFPGWHHGRTGQFVYCLACRRDYMRLYQHTHTESPQQAARRTHRLVLKRIPAPMNQMVIGAYRRAMTSDPCAYCGEQPKPCKWTGKPNSTIDHIVPRSQGGEVAWTNETASCWSCNRLKSTRPLLTFLLDIADRQRCDDDSKKEPSFRGRPTVTLTLTREKKPES